MKIDTYGSDGQSKDDPDDFIGLAYIAFHNFMVLSLKSLFIHLYSQCRLKVHGLAGMAKRYLNQMKDLSIMMWASMS